MLSYYTSNIVFQLNVAFFLVFNLKTAYQLSVGVQAFNNIETEQNAVPAASIAVKALASSEYSVLVSWIAPTESKEIIEYYTVYFKQVGADGKDQPKSQRIVPYIKNKNLSFEATNLISKMNYEFWVTAATKMGEARVSKKVTASPNTTVAAKIASFNDTFKIIYKEDVALPCLAVGVPAPTITWKLKGVLLDTSDNIRKRPDGSLLIRDVAKTDAGEYSCHVENEFGQDTVTHKLIVNTPPNAPQVTLTSTTISSLTIKLGSQGSVETILGYTIHYKPEFGNWETIQIEGDVEKYILENLLCGTSYQIYVTAYNSIGTGEKSDTIIYKTIGGKPVIPSADKFIDELSDSVSLHFNSWLDGECPMLYFVVEYKKKISKEWIQVSNNVGVDAPTFLLRGLEPATWYYLRVTAHNTAGFNLAEYEFATLASGNSN